MTWVAWRQHRGQAAAGAAMLLGYCLLAVAEHRSRRLGGATTSLAVYLPLMIGVFWGAPLLARELESGTHQLAWTQSVTRRRWLAHRLLLAAATGLVLTVALTALVTWGVRGAGEAPNRVSFFDSYGLVPSASMLFGLALGTALGAVLRRTIWSTGVTFAVMIVAPLAFGVARGSDTGRFWVLQGIEAGIYLALALCLLAFVFWWVPRRSG